MVANVQDVIKWLHLRERKAREKEGQVRCPKCGNLHTDTVYPYGKYKCPICKADLFKSDPKDVNYRPCPHCGIMLGLDTKLVDIVRCPGCNKMIRTSTGEKAKNGCFVATACYGNYDAPEVLILRAYRDERLLTNWFGTAFVKFYYFISPPLARQIEKSDKAKGFIRQYFLKPIVDKINSKNE